MKVVYKGRASRRTNSLPEEEGDVLELLSNNWNDYGFETTFMTVCRVGDERVQLGSIKLLFEEPNARSYLKGLLDKGWDGVFPISGVEYISTPGEVAFYEQLDGALSSGTAVKVALALRDASYLVHVKDDAGAQRMVQSTGFKDSLQRERGSIEAFNDGWKILDRESLSARDIEFSFKNVFGDVSTLGFTFSAELSPLPRDINVLIGANGTGKSQLLHQIVDAWIADSKQVRSGKFSTPPSLSRLVVVSYSPFELFPVDMGKSKLKDKDAYKYFGLRGLSVRAHSNPVVSLSREFPKKDSVASLISCIEDDQRYRHIKGWGQKIGTAERVLRAAIKFDTMALRVKSDTNVDQLFKGDGFESSVVEINRAGKNELFISVSAENAQFLNFELLSKHIVSRQGVVFVKNGLIQELSSGQRLFTYLVINVLGAIKRNSLILIDEPELFLHPSLEIQLVEMLKQILNSFNSRAILATHSVSTVREIPSDCVHVLERASDHLIIKQPPFQTFGGDIQRIASYVFGDKSVSKPFESWIVEKLKSMSAAELIELLGAEVNEELIIQIHAMERKQW